MCGLPPGSPHPHIIITIQETGMQMNDIAKQVDFTGKTVVITGATAGIGAGCARVFAQAGADVAFCARNSERGHAFLDELNEAGRGRHSFWICDVSDHHQIGTMMNEIAVYYGRIDILVNNAGFHPPHKPIDEFSVEYFREIVDLNLTSVFAACKYALPHIRKQRGTVINIGSLVGSMGQEWATVYCATKAGISGLTKALAIDEARNGVRVNVVLPGNVVTENRQKFAEESGDPAGLEGLIDSWQWAARSAQAEEIGGVCLFLASGFANYITGSEIIVSGGSELGYGVKHPPMFGERHMITPL